MVVICGKCQRKFNLDDAKIPESGVKVRCSKCGFTFLVQKSAPAPEEKPQPPESRPRSAAPAPPAAPAPKKTAIVPKDEDFSDVLPPASSPPPASEPEDKFRDLFEAEKPKDTTTEDVFGDIFETSETPKPEAALPPRVSAPPPEPKKAPGPPKVPAPPKAVEPEKAPGGDDFDMGQEFKLDEVGGEEMGGFEAPSAAPAASTAPAAPPPAKARSGGAPGAAKDEQDWGNLKFGPEAADTGPSLDLDKAGRPTAPAPGPEKPKPAGGKTPAAPAETAKAPAGPAAKARVPATLSKSASFILNVSFLIAMLLIVLGVGQRFLFKNPVILKRLGMTSTADDLYYRRITKQRQILPFAMKSFWVENQARTQVLVIEGKAFNGTGAPLDISQVSVSLFQPDGKPLETRVLPVGAPVELEEIRNLSQEELAAQVQKKAVGIHLPPNGEFAFRFPLSGIAVQKLNYRLEVK